MLRIIRIALLVIVPSFAVGASLIGCNDDTTNAPADLAVTMDLAKSGDMAKAAGDMTKHD